MDDTLFKNIVKIQKELGRRFHYVQKMCLSFVMDNLKSRFLLLNFGIGTGKSLLCASLAMLLKMNEYSQVVILNKSKYLNHRDYMKYKEIIKRLGSTCLCNKYYPNAIYFWDLKFLETFLTTERDDQFIDKTVFIVDEYDSLLFD
jgi:hypothetical protein